MGVNPKKGGKPPKMDDLFHGKPYFLIDDLGGPPLFLETPIYIKTVTNFGIHHQFFRFHMFHVPCFLVCFLLHESTQRLMNLMTNDFHQIYLSIIQGRCSSSMSVLSLVHPNINCGTNHLPSVTPDCILHLAFRQSPEGGRI